MNHPNSLMLYVDSPVTSAGFYGKLLETAPVEMSETFALFVLQSGLKLALWSKHTVEPVPTATGGGTELAIRMPSSEAVNDLYEKWQSLPAEVVMAPGQLDFGWSFVIADPDGHRLRVYTLDDMA